MLSTLRISSAASLAESKACSLTLRHSYSVTQVQQVSGKFRACLTEVEKAKRGTRWLFASRTSVPQAKILRQNRVIYYIVWIDSYSHSHFFHITNDSLEQIQARVKIPLIQLDLELLHQLRRVIALMWRKRKISVARWLYYHVAGVCVGGLISAQSCHANWGCSALQAAKPDKSGENSFFYCQSETQARVLIRPPQEEPSELLPPFSQRMCGIYLRAFA